MKKALSLILCLLTVMTLFAGLSAGAEESAALPEKSAFDIAETGASYNLWLGSTQVTDANKNDILNDGGKAKYDPVSQTLTLNYPVFSGANAGIKAKDINLTVKGIYRMKNTSTLPEVALSISGGNLTLDGHFAFYGQRFGILARKDVIVKSGTLDVQESTEQTFKGNDITPLFGLIADGVLRIKDDVDCVSAYAASNSWGAAIGAQYIDISDKLEIYEPMNGYGDTLKYYANDYNLYSGYTIYDKNGNRPGSITIKKPGFQWSYNLRIGNTMVTGINQHDILGDGRASFDPSDCTLTLNEPVLKINSGSYNSKIAANKMNLTIKGSYHTDSTSSVYGVDVENGSLTLSGDFSFTGSSAAVKATGDLKVLSGSLTAKGGKQGVSVGNTFSAGSGVKRIEAQGTETAIDSGVLAVTDYLEVIVPRDGTVKYGKIYDSSNAVAKRAVIGKNVIVKTFTVTGITEPQIGAAPNTDCKLPANCGYKAAEMEYGRVTWYTEGGDILNPSTDKFKAGEKYSAQVTLFALEGYEFAESGLTGTMNGKDATHSIFIAKPKRTIYMSRWFTCPKAVTSVSCTVTEPKAGEAPNVSCKLPAGCGYKTEKMQYGDVEWYTEEGDILNPQSDKFKAGEKYVAQVTLVASDGYEFVTSGLTGTINGKDATGRIHVVQPRKKIYINYWFTCPKDAPSGKKILLGDLNGNGKVNNADYQLLARYTLGWSGAKEKIKVFEAADLNQNGKVNNADYQILARYVLGWPGYDKYIKEITV